MDDKNKYTYQAIQQILTSGKDPENPNRFYTQQELSELIVWLNGNLNPDSQEITLPPEEEAEVQKVEIAAQAVDLNENTPADKKQAAWEQILHHNEVLSQTGAPPIPTQIVSQEVSRRATELASKTLSPEIKGKIGELLNKIPQIPDVESVVKKKAVQGLSTRIAARLGLASLGAAASAGVYLLVEADIFILNKAKDLLRSGLIKLTGDGDGSNLAAVSLGAAALGIFFPPAFGLALVTGGLSYIQGGSEGFKKAGQRSVLLFLAIMGAFMSVVIWPIVISLIAIPLFIGFTILVITNSSYVVPPGSSVYKDLGGGIFLTQTCFVLNGSWPETYKANMIRATEFMAQTGAYMDKICSKGPVYLTYSGTETYGGEVISSNTILIYELGSSTVGSAIYTLAHESGHIFAHRYPSVQNELYRGDVGVSSERPVCTYPLPHRRGMLVEDFAEMIALFIYTNPVIGYTEPSATRNLSCISPSFNVTYPNHVNFAAQYIFESRMGW